MIDTIKLRKALGWLGMLLPWIVAILYMILEVKTFKFPESISATYYCDSCITPFMIILGSAGLLLMTYSGYDTQDKIVCTLAGIFGIMICLFPCFSTLKYVGTFQIPVNISGWIHNISAFIFFGLLAYNSLFLFTKSSGEMTSEKKKRNIIFRVCGVGMIASFLLLIPLWNVSCGIWIVEAIALSFFGISWLTKSQCYNWLFKDKK
jgi:hypothetical protein